MTKMLQIKDKGVLQNNKIKDLRYNFVKNLLEKDNDLKKIYLLCNKNLYFMNCVHQNYLFQKIGVLI
jgi:hypothetical protein